jgi:hypothetical protein
MGGFPWFGLKGLPFPPDPDADSSRPGEALSLSFFANVFLLVSSFLPERWRWRTMFYHSSETALLLSFTFFFSFLFPPFVCCLLFFDLLPSVTCWSFVVGEQGHGDVKRYILFRNWVISNE